MSDDPVSKTVILMPGGGKIILGIRFVISTDFQHIQRTENGEILYGSLQIRPTKKPRPSLISTYSIFNYKLVREDLGLRRTAFHSARDGYL